ncbi:MAG: nicotinate-nucleotide--dimethylbenzimidazole phosphoribosyltransferase [Bellilinea sp.]|nr:MAG: nicotinate-nucleotide--dimethylbenzimidazole phosphoribosyltransferase [Bellilinea sp.]
MNLNLPLIPPFDQAAAEAARQRQNRLTKPTGALGRLETLSVQLAGITACPRPRFHHKAVILMAADHGVAAEGVSAYPPEVTAQMVLNFQRGGAAINVLARQAGAQVTVVDIGVNYDFDDLPGVLHRKIALGTANLRHHPAMSRAQAEQAIQTGLEVAEEHIRQGVDLIATGEMGIGNTTPAAAITAVMTGKPVDAVTGRGTGLDEAGLVRKVKVIREAIARHRPDPQDALDVLARIGGFEIGGLAGVMIAAATRRVPVVVDGFISGAAALIAAGLKPEIKPYLIASHLSQEIGHRAIWEALGLHPLLNLDLRLGEGSGAVLAFHLIEAATRILDEMATFDEAGVSDRS